MRIPIVLAALLASQSAQAEFLIKDVDDYGDVHFCSIGENGSVGTCKCCFCEPATSEGRQEGWFYFTKQNASIVSVPSHRLFTSDEKEAWHCRGSQQSPPEGSSNVVDTTSPCGILSTGG